MEQPTPNLDPIANLAPSSPTKPPYLIIGLLALLFVIATSGISAYFYFQNQTLKKQVAIIPAQPTLLSTPTSAPTITESYPTYGQINWLPEPKITTLTPFLKTLDPKYGYVSQTEEIKFYQVATFANSAKLIIALIPQDGPGGGFNQRLYLIQSSDNSLLYIDNILADYEKAYYKNILVSTILPTNLVINGLVGPETINYNKQLYSKVYDTTKLLSDLIAPQPIFTSSAGQIYQVSKSIINDVPEVMGKIYYLRLKTGLMTQYQLTDGTLHKLDWLPQITWSDNTKNTFNYSQNIVMSCGGGSVGVPYIKDGSPLISNKKIIGKNDVDSQPVYQLLDQENSLVKTIYNIYKVGRENTSTPPILSLSEFAQRRNHFLWQDTAGDWQIYLSDEFAPQAECGKPVIYLYPQIETEVNVKVDAKITKSEPLYPPEGWSVKAKPNGQIIYQGQVYPYLFWEGKGAGVYPDYRNQGFVVTQKDLIPTIYDHLSKLGLNSRESADFMEFWQPKLPHTPYVRLTWLGTQDMNRLAPLNVTPQPNTVIRLFLEFAGLEKPIVLIPQSLTAPVRSGFTLIEWGGLLLKP